MRKSLKNANKDKNPSQELNIQSTVEISLKDETSVMTLNELSKEFNELNEQNVEFKNFSQAEDFVNRSRNGEKFTGLIFIEPAEEIIEEDSNKPKKVKKVKLETSGVKLPRKIVHTEAHKIRHFVIVNGVEYRSVLQAFQALDLPIVKHIPFRAKLKAAGELEFNGILFKAVKLETTVNKGKKPKKIKTSEETLNFDSELVSATKNIESELSVQ